MNIQKLMQEAQKMQREVSKNQDIINSTEFAGSSELCDIVIMGDHTVKQVNMKVDKLDEDDMEILEDMIKIAYNEALGKLNKFSDEKMSKFNKMPGLF